MVTFKVNVPSQARAYCVFCALLYVINIFIAFDMSWHTWH